jgi:hypothetical protein
LPLPVTLQAWWRPLGASHVAKLARASNPGAPRLFAPAQHLDRAPTFHRRRVPLATEPHWGFPHPGCAAVRGEGWGKWGKERRSGEEGASARDAAGAPRPDAARVHGGRSYCTPHQRGAGTEQGVERHCERLHRAAFFVEPATTTSPTQREMNHSLALSCIVPLP